MLEGLKILELCVFHAEVCGGWEVEGGGGASAREVACVAARQALKLAPPQGEII